MLKQFATYGINIIESVLEKYNFNINTRSENIPYYVFVELANELWFFVK